MLTFLSKEEDSSVTPDEKDQKFNISMMKDWTIEYRITTQDEIIVKYSKLRNAPVRAHVGSRKCDCGCGMPFDVHEFHRQNDMLYFTTVHVMGQNMCKRITGTPSRTFDGVPHH